MVVIAKRSAWISVSNTLMMMMLQANVGIANSIHQSTEHCCKANRLTRLKDPHFSIPFNATMNVNQKSSGESTRRIVTVFARKQHIALKKFTVVGRMTGSTLTVQRKMAVIAKRSAWISVSNTLMMMMLQANVGIANSIHQSTEHCCKANRLTRLKDPHF